jgi:glycosyltransferase involved in cell wall biosynthesis
MAQGVDTLVDAARRAGPQAVRVELAGGGAELDALRARVAAEAIDNVIAYGTVPAARIPALYARTHAGAVLLRDRPLFEGALPTKLLECLAAGRPVLLSARGEAAELVRHADAGIVVAPEDPRGLAEAFAALASPEARRAYGERARAAAAGFDRGLAVDRWLELLQRERR